MTRMSPTPDRLETLSPAFKKLNDADKMFVREYLEHFNASRAARAAGYEGEQPHREGYRRRIKATVDAAVKELLHIVGVTEERIIENMTAIVEDCDLGDFEPYLEDGKTLKMLRDEDGVNTRMVKAIRKRIDKDGNVTRHIELYD